MMFWAALLWFAGMAGAQEVGKLCLSCHTEYVDELKTHKHASKNISCEVCHGESKPHRNAIGATSPDRVAAPDEVPALCGSCHPAQRKSYEAGKHGVVLRAQSKVKTANCGTCHGVHGPRNAVSMERQCARCHAELPASCKKPVTVEAGKLRCAGCHDPHTAKRR